MSFFYLLTGAAEERELAALELWVLSGVWPRGAVGEGPVAVDVSGAAYTRFCAETLATGADLEELAANTRAAQIEAHGFRLQVYRPAPRAVEAERSIILAVAAPLIGAPDLDHPRVRLVVVPQPGYWRLGRLISASHSDWRAAPVPPDCSSALPAQVARALVNLVASPGESLIDPCCGVGTVLVQAASGGVRAVGIELNKKLAGRAAHHLRAARAPALVVAGDARCLTGHAEAAVLDLPYGRSSRRAPNLYQEILANLPRLASRAALVTAEPLGELLPEAGLRLLHLARIHSGSLTRHVHLVVADPPGPEPPGARGVTTLVPDLLVR